MTYRMGPWRKMLHNIIESLSPNKLKVSGKFIGDDYFGNKFYEIPSEPSKGRRMPKRWFVAPPHGHIDYSEMSAEWDAWLRLRRDKPPTVEELTTNLSIATTKKEKGDIIEAGNIKSHADRIYPQYEEYESTPGELKKK